MFAVIAGGMATTCKTHRELERILALYPYGSFQKVANKDEAFQWLSTHKRNRSEFEHKHYGNTAATGYVQVEYFITGDAVYYNLDTSKVGNIRTDVDENCSMSTGSNLIKIKVSNIALDDVLIAHHCIAIKRILRLLGEFVDVDIIVPDISIFLAVTKYSGENYVIRGLQRDIQKRLGGFSITVKE